MFEKLKSYKLIYNLSMMFLFVSKILISNIKYNILFGSFAEINENVKNIKNNKSNDL